MSKKQAIIISVISIIIFTDILFCLGAFGITLTETARMISVKVIKWFFILLGYFICIVVPYRVIYLLNKREETNKEIKKDIELERVTKQNNDLIKELEKTYYGDSI